MGVKVIITGALYFSRLCVESLGLVTQAIVKRRKARSTFQKTLLLQGIPPEIARQLAEEYPNPVKDVLNLVRLSAYSN